MLSSKIDFLLDKWFDSIDRTGNALADLQHCYVMALDPSWNAEQAKHWADCVKDAQKNVRQQQDGLIVKLHNATKGIDDSLPLMRVHLAKALQAATARHWQTTSNDQDHHIRHAFAAESYSQNNEPALIEIAHYVGKAVTESVRRAMNDPTINLLTERKAVCREYWKAVALTAPSLQSFDALKQGTLLETLRTPSKYELTPIRHACLWTQIESDIVGKQMAHTIMPEGVAVIPEIFMGSENRYLGINPPPAITYGR